MTGMKRYALLFFFFWLFPFNLIMAQNGQYISFKQKTELLENQKKSSSILDVYYDHNKNTITKYIHSPEEMILVTNQLGEIKIYYPTTNQVAYKQSDELSSSKNFIYYFSNNLTDDLGLENEGFNLMSRDYDSNYMVTIWKAPAELKLIDQVKMVYEGANPIYAEYTNLKGEILKKIYYSHYTDFYSFRMPLRITEVAFRSDGDSTLNRTIISDVKVSTLPENDYFNFKIPDDALPIKPQ